MQKSQIVDIINVFCLVLFLVNRFWLGNFLWLKLLLLGVMIVCLIIKIRDRNQG